MNQSHIAAEVGAQKICGQGQCRYSFGCGHPNNRPGYRKIGNGQVCPLSKYQVQPEVNPAPFYERPRSETAVTISEICALCEACEHARVNPDGALELIGFYEFCLDCPVKGVEDYIQESHAEAGCS